MSSFSLQSADISSVGAQALEGCFVEHDHESGDCCPGMDCRDSLACSLSCTSSCSVPQVAVLGNLFYRDLSSSTVITFDLDSGGFAAPLGPVLFRPPIA